MAGRIRNGAIASAVGIAILAVKYFTGSLLLKQNAPVPAPLSSPLEVLSEPALESTWVATSLTRDVVPTAGVNAAMVNLEQGPLQALTTSSLPTFAFDWSFFLALCLPSMVEVGIIFAIGHLANPISHHIEVFCAQIPDAIGKITTVVLALMTAWTTSSYIAEQCESQAPFLASHAFNIKLFCFLVQAFFALRHSLEQDSFVTVCRVNRELRRHIRELRRALRRSRRAQDVSGKEIEALRTAIATQEDAAKKMKLKTAENVELRARIQEVEATIKSNDDKLKATKRNGDKFMNSHKRYESLNRQSEELKELAKCRAKHVTSVVTGTDARIRELEEKLAESEADSTRLQEDHDSVLKVKDAEVQKLKADSARHQQDHDFKSQLKDKEIQDLEAKIHSLEDNMYNMKDDLKYLETRAKERNASIQWLEREVKTHSDDLAQSRADVQALDAEIKKLADRIKKIEDDHKKQIKKIEDGHTKQIEQLEEDHQAVIDELEDQFYGLNMKDETLAELTEERGEAAQQLADFDAGSEADDLSKRRELLVSLDDAEENVRGHCIKYLKGSPIARYWNEKFNKEHEELEKASRELQASLDHWIEYWRSVKFDEEAIAFADRSRQPPTFAQWRRRLIGQQDQTTQSKTSSNASPIFSFPAFNNAGSTPSGDFRPDRPSQRNNGPPPASAQDKPRWAEVPLDIHEACEKVALQPKAATRGSTKLNSPSVSDATNTFKFTSQTRTSSGVQIPRRPKSVPTPTSQVVFDVPFTPFGSQEPTKTSPAPDSTSEEVTDSAPPAVEGSSAPVAPSQDNLDPTPSPATSPPAPTSGSSNPSASTQPTSTARVKPLEERGYSKKKVRCSREDCLGDPNEYDSEGEFIALQDEQGNEINKFRYAPADVDEKDEKTKRSKNKNEKKLAQRKGLCYVCHLNAPKGPASVPRKKKKDQDQGANGQTTRGYGQKDEDEDDEEAQKSSRE